MAPTMSRSSAQRAMICGWRSVRTLKLAMIRAASYAESSGQMISPMKVLRSAEILDLSIVADWESARAGKVNPVLERNAEIEPAANFRNSRRLDINN